MLLRGARSTKIFSSRFVTEAFEMLAVKALQCERSVAVLEWYASRELGGEDTEIVLTAGGSVVGTIQALTDGRYRVFTKGYVPAIDGLTAPSFKHLWAKIGERVREGGVYSMRLITGVQDAHGT